MSTTIALESADATMLTEQLGLGDIGLFPESGPMQAELALTGSAADGFEASVSLEGGGDSLTFVGGLNVADIERWTGTGVVRAALSDPTPLAERLGAQGLSLPAIEGNADIAFAGVENLALNDIDLRSSGSTVIGQPDAADDRGRRAGVGRALRWRRSMSAGLWRCLRDRRR